VNPRRLGVFWWTAVFVLALDMATKLVVYNTMELGRPPLRLLGDFVRFTYIQNAGAAFGLFQGNRWFFVAVSSISIVAVIVLARAQRYRRAMTGAAFGLILGGALGNLIDRLWLGQVIDFVDLGFGSHRWPVFNVADIGVTGGVILLALSLLREEQPAGEALPEEAPPMQARPREDTGGAAEDGDTGAGATAR